MQNDTWPTKSELRYAYYGRNKARIFNGAIDSANLKKCTMTNFIKLCYGHPKCRKNVNQMTSR
jgi:hypothetical protein